MIGSFSKCVKEYENSNKDFKFCTVLVESMKTVLNPSPDILMDIILFTSVYVQIDKDFLSEL